MHHTDVRTCIIHTEVFAYTPYTPAIRFSTPLHNSKASHHLHQMSFPVVQVSKVLNLNFYRWEVLVHTVKNYVAGEGLKRMNYVAGKGLKRMNYVAGEGLKRMNYVAGEGLKRMNYVAGEGLKRMNYVAGEGLKRMNTKYQYH